MSRGPNSQYYLGAREQLESNAMTREMEQILEEIVRRIAQVAQPEQIVLFGSHTTGGAGPDSDLDLLVIESEPFTEARSRLEEIAKLERAVGRIPIPTDILVYSRQEVETWKHSLNHVVGRALREGKLVYARS